ncbi:uncharacterized protein [Branchiostoma lanceolatum]|uniref:uncharacterized protein n=1 Tax=Branchiostoma lanceolatum TaxID=7740 RepID=UPI00345641F3
MLRDKLKLTINIFLFLGLLWLTNAGYPRLHFAGNFLADTATLNNDPRQFNIHKFNASRDPPCYLNYTFPHCNWNPQGSSDFRFVNCFVKKVCYKDAKCSKFDALVGKRIIGSDDNVAAKMTDLDPFFQMYTAQLWGLVVGVEGAFRGKFKTNTVRDVWQRCKDENCSGDPGTSGYWSSVLTNVTWMEEATDSRFINELRYHEQDNTILNIKFTVDLMHEDPGGNDFALGRVIGTISAVDGSLELLPEFNRMLWWQGPQWLSSGQPSVSAEKNSNVSDFCNAPFYVDIQNSKVVVDLSNSLPTNLEGDLIHKGNLFLVILPNDFSFAMAGGKITDCSALLHQGSNKLGRIPYTNSGFLVNDTGIATFCLIAAAYRSPLMIVREEEPRCPDCPTQCTPVLVEHLDGLYIGPAEDRVFRIPQPKTEIPILDEEDKSEEDEDGKVCWSLTVFAARFGRPKAGVFLSVQQYNRPGVSTGEPADAIEIRAGDCRGHAKATTNAYGIGAFHFKTNEEGLDCSRRPSDREHLFGQLYIYSVTLSDDKSFPPDLLTSTHLYCKLDKKDSYTWHEDIYPILKLYENLYPVMKPLFNLANKMDVKRHLDPLYYTLGLPVENPNHMPVTRDLSPAKRDMVLDWLKPKSRLSVPSPNARLEAIKENLHRALRLEWATIPPYLSAYYSLKDRYNEKIARLLKSIVIEEMKHMSMVANILNYLGQAPILNDPNKPLRFPTHLPGGVMPGLNVELAKFSLDVTHDVFMAVETPECNKNLLKVHHILRGIPHRAPPIEVPKQCLKVEKKFNCDLLCEDIIKKCEESNKDFDNTTIGAVYIHKILCPMVKLYNSTPDLFAPKDDYLKKQVPIPFCVLDICSAIEGIKLIVAEGEGSDPCNPFYEGELSHYYKFKEIWKGRKLKETANSVNDGDEDPFFTPCGKDMTCPKNYSFSGDKIPFQEEGVWPTVVNPNTSKYPPGSRVRILSDSFNQKYVNMMNCLHEVYNGNPGLFSQCYALMTSLTVDAKRLVQTPIHPGGPHGAPTFEWQGSKSTIF